MCVFCCVYMYGSVRGLSRTCVYVGVFVLCLYLSVIARFLKSCNVSEDLQEKDVLIPHSIFLSMIIK